MEEGGVFHSTVFELFLPQVWTENTRRLTRDQKNNKSITLIKDNATSGCGSTCVVEDRVFDRAVLEECVGRLDVLKVAVLKERILKLDGFNLNVCKSLKKKQKKPPERQKWQKAEP